MKDLYTPVVLIVIQIYWYKNNFKLKLNIYAY